MFVNLTIIQLYIFKHLVLTLNYYDWLLVWVTLQLSQKLPAILQVPPIKSIG